MSLFNQNNNFEGTQFGTMSVASFTFNLNLYRGMVSKIENGFYSLGCFHCKYFKSRRDRKFCFLYKTTHLSRQSFKKWLWSVLRFVYFNKDA